MNKYDYHPARVCALFVCLMMVPCFGYAQEDTAGTESAQPQEVVQEPPQENAQESGEEKGTDWGSLFGKVLKEAVDHEVDRKADITSFKVIEKTGNEIRLEVRYRRVYKYENVELEAYVLDGGEELEGFDSTVVSLEGKEGRARLKLNWADAVLDSSVVSDQIKVVLSREGHDFKSKTFDLKKVWTAYTDPDVPPTADSGGESTTSAQDSAGSSQQPGTAVAPAPGSIMVRPKLPITLPVLPAANRIPLKLYWSSARQENMTLASAASENAARRAGYRYVRLQGYCYDRAVTNDAVPLKLFYNSRTHDNYVTSTPAGEKRALATGYRYVRTECYILSKYHKNTKVLRTYHNPGRNDYFTATSPDGIAAARRAGYRYMGVEGYVPAVMHKYIARTSLPVKKAGKVYAAGTTWDCQTRACQGEAAGEKPAVSACSALAKVVGRIIYFGHARARLTARQLDSCNNMQARIIQMQQLPQQK